MLPQDAEKLTLSLMLKHGLIHNPPNLDGPNRDWKFEFDLAYNRFGQCRYGTRKITLSKVLTTFNPIEIVTDTILHEIAHALVGFENGHGPIWRHCASKIGATPKACYGEEVNRIWVNGRINL